MKEVEPFIKSFSYRAYRRATAAGAASMSLEDIRQECWIGWVIACDSYDETTGVPFFPYARRGIMQHVNRFIERTVERCIEEIHAESFDADQSFNGSWETKANKEVKLADAIPSGEMGADTRVLLENNYQRALARLTPRARLFVKLLQEQPEELLAEVIRIGKRCDHARDLGVVAAHQNRLTAAMVFDLMGAARAERHQITKEVKKLGERMVNAA